MYLVHSPEHSSDVALVLNLTTGLVLPQYHVVFDDTFSTLESLLNQKESSNWEVLCKYHTENYKMNALPTDQGTAADLQSEVMDWMQDSSSDQESDTFELTSSKPCMRIMTHQTYQQIIATTLDLEGEMSVEFNSF